jgi:hypothetical protein
METAEIVHDADPFQNRPALGASREIDVEAPVRGGRRMLEDVGIHPLNDVVHKAGERLRPWLQDSSNEHPGYRSRHDDGR